MTAAIPAPTDLLGTWTLARVVRDHRAGELLRHARDRISARVRLVGRSERAAHAVVYLVDDTHQVLSYVMEEIFLHIDMASRKTAPWPDDRETVDLGRLVINALAFDREHDGDVLVFDPTRVPDGIVLSADPILHARSGAYGVSVARRTR